MSNSFIIAQPNPILKNLENLCAEYVPQIHMNEVINAIQQRIHSYSSDNFIKLRGSIHSKDILLLKKHDFTTELFDDYVIVISW